MSKHYDPNDPCVCGHPRGQHRPDFDSDWCEGNDGDDLRWSLPPCRCRDFLLAYDEYAEDENDPMFDHDPKAPR
jgi:hypothetical protein